MTDTDLVTDCIARTVRALRRSRRWSIDALAARAGVSRGIVIQIEQARTNPSIGTLVRIADAFGVSIGKLVELTDQPAARVVRSGVAATLWESPAGGHARLLAGTDAPPLVELWLWHLQAGDHRRSEAHVHGSVEMITVLEGRVAVTVDAEEYLIDVGDTIVFRADRSHGYAVHDAPGARFMMVVSTPDLPAMHTH